MAYSPADPAATSTLIGVLWPPLLLALAWYPYHRLSPGVPAVLAATCALTFAWVLVAPWSLPWYTAAAWVTLALSVSLAARTRRCPGERPSAAWPRRR
jgi:hypothetical protein